MTANSAATLGPEFPLSLDRPFTYRQALDAGISRRRVSRLVETGLVRRILKGVYVACQARDSQLLRARALQLVVPDGMVVTDESAGWLAGAPMILRPGAHRAVPPLSLFGTSGHDRVRNELTASGTRGLEPEDIMTVHGVPATTPLRTAYDLGRLRPVERALSALDQLLRTSNFSHDELLNGIDRFKGYRGVRQLRVIAPIADPRSESPGESLLRWRFAALGLPEPTPQLDIFGPRGDFLARVDLAVEDLKLIAEYDGEEWHGAERVEHDRSRREALVRAGWTVLVFTREHVGASADVDGMLCEGVRQARRRLGLGHGEPPMTT